MSTVGKQFKAWLNGTPISEAIDEIYGNQVDEDMVTHKIASDFATKFADETGFRVTFSDPRAADGDSVISVWASRAKVLLGTIILATRDDKIVAEPGTGYFDAKGIKLFKKEIETSLKYIS